MAGDGEGTGEGTQTGDGTGQQQTQIPAWTAQLPETLKANEAFTKYQTIGDLGKSHLEILGKVKELDGISAKVGELEGKLSTAIPKLPENPTKEQVDAFYASLGRPAKPEEYEFPKGEGVEHDENMIKWASNLFYEVGLTKEQGARMGGAWDKFVQGLVQAEADLDKKTEEEANKNFRAMFKSDEEYNANLELSKRFWKKITNTELNTFATETGLYMHPTFLKFIIETAKKTGEDVTPKSSGGGTGELIPGMIYDKTPQHQRK